MCEAEDLKTILESGDWNMYKAFTCQLQSMPEVNEVNLRIKSRVQAYILRKIYNKKREEKSSLKSDLRESEKSRFREGDIVVWKKGLKNKENPEYDQPAIVMKILNHSTSRACKDVGSQYYGEMTDMTLGIIKAFDSFELINRNRSNFNICDEL